MIEAILFISGILLGATVIFILMSNHYNKELNKLCNDMINKPSVHYVESLKKKIELEKIFPNDTFLWV